jgi:hypothetical protein
MGSSDGYRGGMFRIASRIALTALILTLVAATRPEGSSVRPPAAPEELLENYEARTVLGFEVRIHRDLIEKDPALLERVMRHLAADLDEVVHLVPPPALAVVRDTTIWIEHQGYGTADRGGRGMCCHWSPVWLRAHGLLVEKAGGVEIINPSDFVSWRTDQPYMLLHELAHALHWRLPGLNGEIDQAWRAAKEAGFYEDIVRNTLPLDRPLAAYAITNSHEYFAELSEAYLALNDFYPFSRRQLIDHDPAGHALMKRIWNLDPDALDSLGRDAVAGQ